MAQFAPRDNDTDAVLYAQEGVLGRIRLNRPSVINALDLDMVTSMTRQLQEWASDDSIAAVALDGAGDRGLCAGGDIRWLRQLIIDSGPEAAIDFWKHEYRLDALIAEYAKPVVAYMNGVTMGGGIGVSGHASLRLTTEDAKIAMPETGIGLFPDVGASYLLARAPGETGTHLAMSGLPVDGRSAVACGLADGVVDNEQFEKICAGLADGDSVQSHRFESTDDAPIDAAREWIDECYRGDDAVAILTALREHSSKDARSAAKTVASRSPLSVAVSLEAVRRASKLSLRGVFAQDARLGHTFATDSDLLEGVRAVIVDKDHNPSWRDKSLSDVDMDRVRAMFAK